MADPKDATKPSSGGTVRATVHPHSGVDIHEAADGRVYRRGEISKVSQADFDKDSQHTIVSGGREVQVVVQEGSAPEGHQVGREGGTVVAGRSEV